MINLTKPFIIDFEGIDGTFKYTNACKLQDYIESKYTSKVVVVSFPNYGGKSSYLLQEYFKTLKKSKELSPKMISILFMLDMYDTFYKEIKKFYDNNYIIIFDRYWYSNIYYQGTLDILLKNKDIIDRIINVYIFEVLYTDFEKKIVKLNDNEFNLPRANIIFKMIHNKMDSNIIINRRKKEDKNYNNEINEDKTNLLNYVNLFLRSFPFKYGDKFFSQYNIDLDETNNLPKGEDIIFNSIKDKFDNDLKRFLQKG